MKPHVRDAWITKLKALSDIARLIPYPLGGVIPNDIADRLADDNPTPEDLAELAGRTRRARRLFQALTDPVREVPIRCTKTRRRGPGSDGARSLGEVRDQQVVTVRNVRGPVQPSGWRPIRTLVVDLDLLNEEGGSGLAIDCETCSQTHLLKPNDLTAVSSEILPLAAGTGPLPSGYRHVESAAFAEVWGTFDQAKMNEPTPDVYLQLPPRRDEAYRRHFAGNTAAITGQYELLAGYKQRVVDGFFSGNLTLASPPSDPAQRISDPPTATVASVGSDPGLRLTPTLRASLSPSTGKSFQGQGL